MMSAAWLAPEVMRVVIPAALLVGYVGYHAWRWRTMHPTANAEEPMRAAAENEPAKGGVGEDEVKVEGPIERVSPEAKPSLRSKSLEGCEIAERSVGLRQEKVEVEGQGQQSIDRLIEYSNNRMNGTSTLTPQTPVAGEEDYRRARVMVHQEIPDFRIDGLYLDLLGESADKGYTPAMAKLGEYAMRRGTWIEAYYWMWRAQRGGMANLESVLSGIRQCWITAGCQNEEENVHDLFDEERGSIGRALLGIAASRDAAAARDFLKTNHPELLI